MRIPCPFCGPRGIEEFSYRGDAAPRRPVADAPPADALAYVHERENPAGWIEEYWYHGAGCRSWLIVRRNTRTHEIVGAFR
jgi:methylglutamate dehydrogenase subunit B